MVIWLSPPIMPKCVYPIWYQIRLYVGSKLYWHSVHPWWSESLLWCSNKLYFLILYGKHIVRMPLGGGEVYTWTTGYLECLASHHNGPIEVHWWTSVVTSGVCFWELHKPLKFIAQTMEWSTGQDNRIMNSLIGELFSLKMGCGFCFQKS